jgi:hypothetical protein
MEHLDKLYVVYLQGRLSMRDSSIKTYRTIEAARANNQRWVDNGWKVEIVEFSRGNVYDGDSDE